MRRSTHETVDERAKPLHVERFLDPVIGHGVEKLLRPRGEGATGREHDARGLILDIIQGSCAELLALGISPLGRYVQVEEEPLRVS